MKIVAVRLPKGRGFTKPNLFGFKTTRSANEFIKDVKKTMPKAEFLTASK
jgi:hypothetical protein